jgi:hypothetical protein
VPEGTHNWISDKADMSSIVFDSYVPDIAAVAMIVTPQLDNCKEYFWQMASISEGVEGPASPIRRFVIDRDSTCGCTEMTVPIPELTVPFYFQQFADTNVTIEWESPGGCIADGSTVKLAADPFYEDDSLDQYLSGEFITGYNPPSLEPATQYWTKVAYSVEGGGDPFIGEYSPSHGFFTGPECTSLTEVVAPMQLYPLDGSTIDTLAPPLRYTPGTPACIPDGYYLSLHMAADLSDPNLLGEFGLPSTTVLPDPPLLDCTTYYWTVKAVQDAGYGPVSPVWSFTTDVDGTCGTPDLPGVPGTAKTNHFCRACTYPKVCEALWTIEEGDKILAIARNFQTTYLKLNILDPKTLEPLDWEIHCWSYVDNFEPGWPDSPDPEIYSFKVLPIEEPPDPGCHSDLAMEACLEAGGKWNYKMNRCDCYE